jgi:hypothetical protein
METQPDPRSGYGPEMVELVQSVCLYVFTLIGDYSQEVVVAGGLVPVLIIPQDPPPHGADRHVGTRDLDLGLSLDIFDNMRYRQIAERLQRAGFSPDLSREGNPTLQRWRLQNGIAPMVDFLIPQTTDDDVGGSIKHLESDFGAIVTPGLELAFQDRLPVTLSGSTPSEEVAEREIWVAGPGAFVILKALAFGNRGESKDAYDLYYVVRNYGFGVGEVAEHIRALSESPHAGRAVDVLRKDFENPEDVGPARVARFMHGRNGPDTQADVAGFIGRLLSLI